MITERGGEIAQIVRGELLPLTDDERNEILQSRRSYYPDDLVVSGWIAALVYDTPEDALPLMQLRICQFAVARIPLLRRDADPLAGGCLPARWPLAEDSGEDER